MIIDQETNTLYLADTLQVKYRSFYDRLQHVLLSADISTLILPGTKDIWAVDYMPIQVQRDKFVQFIYYPDYLKKSKRWRDTISDVDQIVDRLRIEVIKSDIVLDGGNVIRWKDKVIMCDKVFRENPRYPENLLRQQLENLFEVDSLIFVPQDPSDEIGHADGMVRFLDGDTVLVNDYTKESKEFQWSFKTALLKAGLECDVIPYNPYKNSENLQAIGCYLNYLQMEQVLIIPVFNMDEDDKIVSRFENLYPDANIIAINSDEIAKEGGVLNCISWNILAR